MLACDIHGFLMMLRGSLMSFFLHDAFVSVSASVSVSVWTFPLLGVLNEHALGILHSRTSK